MFLAPAHIALSKSPEKVTNSSIIKKFPVKFWRIVNSCKTGAVCWGFGGNSIRILKERFEEEYLFGENKPFKTATFSSFIRQLNLYGFKKIVRPSIINEHGQKLNTSLVEYKHALFLKGHPELLQRIHRNTKTQKRRERKNPSGESTQSVPVCVSDPKIKREVREDGYGYTIHRQVIKEDGVSAFQDVTNLQDRTSGKSVPWESVPDQAASPSTLPACTGQTLVSVQLPVTKLPLFRQPPGRNMVKFAPGPYGHAANSKPSIQQIAPVNINRPNSANAAVPYPLLGHNRNTGPLDMIKLEPSLDTVKPDTGTGRRIRQVCEALPPVPNYRLNTSDVPIPGLMLDTTHQLSRNISLNPDQKPQPVSCTAGTFPIQPCPVQTHPHGFAMAHGLTSNVSKPMRHNVFPGNTQRHPVLYINKTPRIPIAPRPVMNTAQFQRPPPLRPQYALYDNEKPTVPKIDNSGCGEMAIHPLLRPVRQTFDCTSVSNATDATTYSKYVLKPNIHLQSIPVDTSSASEHTESNVSLDDDRLVDLSHFKLSSTLKDIDAPCEENIEVVDYNSHTLSTSYIINTATSGVTTITSSVPAAEQTCQVPEHNMKISPEDTFSVPAKDDNQICSEDSTASSPSPATAFWEVTTLTPPSTGPKRQLFKNSVTRRLTIPVSGLPRDLFSVQTAAGEITDQSEAVITLETSEDGHVTGHLILPGKDAEGSKSTEL
ncbi:transcription factor SFL1-like [Haliotis rubra]|uniref:transcription factor SFL1-like n=1 Tax=Haliotis rubra TaxID=36100 RepID=UPI001EE5E9D6|nr:transcription factor SFL1-like [Haliotis rubra]